MEFAIGDERERGMKEIRQRLYRTPHETTIAPQQGRRKFCPFNAEDPNVAWKEVQLKRIAALGELYKCAERRDNNTSTCKILHRTTDDVSRVQTVIPIEKLFQQMATQENLLAYYGGQHRLMKLWHSRIRTTDKFQLRRAKQMNGQNNHRTSERRWQDNEVH